MAAYEKKRGRIPGRKDATESGKGISVTQQKSSFSNTPRTLASRYPSVCTEHIKVAQHPDEPSETVRTASIAIYNQIPMKPTAAPVCGQSTAYSARESHSAADEGSYQVADIHGQRDLARLSRDAAATHAKMSLKACSGSRPQRREHAKERNTLASPKGVKSAEGKTSHHIEAVTVCPGAAQQKSNDAASPASTTSEEAHVFVRQGKDVTDTTYGSSLNLQQLSQSSTSATPPASDCSTDESPSSSPDVTEEAATNPGRPFEPVAAGSTNSVLTIEADGELALAGKSSDDSCAKSGESSARNESDRSSNCGDSHTISGSARISPASNWPLASTKDTQERRRLAAQSTKKNKTTAQRGQSPSSGRTKVNKGHNQRASCNQRVSGHGNATADNRVALTANCGLSTYQVISHPSTAQDPAHHDPSSAPQSTAVPPPPSLPLTHAAKHSVSVSAAREGVSPTVGGRADTFASLTASDWRCPSPGSLEAEQETLHGGRPTADRGRPETQENSMPTQKRADVNRQPRGTFGRGPGGCTEDKAAPLAVVHKINTVGPKCGDTSPGGQGLLEENAKSAASFADTPSSSWKHPQQSTSAAVHSGIMPLSCVIDNISTDANPNRALDKIAPTPTHQPPPPPAFPPYPSSSSATPVPRSEHSTDTPFFAVDADAYNKPLNHFSTTLGCNTEEETHSLSKANAAYTPSEHRPSEPLLPLQQHMQYGDAIRVTQQIAGALESPKEGDRHKHRTVGTHIPTSTGFNAGDARTWASSCAETNSPNWLLTGSTEVMAKPGNLTSTNTVPPPLASSNTFSGNVTEGGKEEGGQQCLGPVHFIPCNSRNDSFTPATSYALDSGDGEPAALFPKPFQHARSPASIKMAGTNDTIGFPLRYRGGGSTRGHDTGSAESAVAQCYPSPPPKLHGCGYHAGPGYPLSEARLDTISPAEVPSSLLHEKHKHQSWQKATSFDFCSTTWSESRCCSSCCCSQSSQTSHWQPTDQHSAKSSSSSNRSCIEGGAFQTHQPALLSTCPTRTVNNNYENRAQEKTSGLHRMDCPMPTKHTLQQEERQQANSRMVGEVHGLSDNCPDHGGVTDGTVVDVPRGISGSNSGVLWSMNVPPISLLLTLPLNLPYGKIVKFGSPSVLPQTTVVLPPPPPPTDQVLGDSNSQKPICGFPSCRPTMTRTLGAKKSYYCFSPTLHPGAYTLFSHAGGICDTFAASLHLELAILYVPPPLLVVVASIFQALAQRLPRLASPLRLECGGLEERNAPGRFGGKVLTVSCAVGDQHERYKFQQMQEFLMLFQSKVELVLREYTLQQQLLLGRQSTSNGHHRQGQGGASAPGKKHNIWRYAMSCMPINLGGHRLSGTSPAFHQGNVALNSGNTVDGIGSSTGGMRADARVTEGETLTFTGSNNGGGGTGGGFLDLTIRAFEAKALDKPTKDYAKTLVVKDVCVSEIRLVTTRGIEDKTCEIDPRFPQYSIGTRPIVLGPNGQLCRHSLVDVHALPDVWEVRLRPGNTRDEQKRLVERCVLASIENKPLQVRNEALKAAIDAGVILWVNGKIMLLPPPPPPAPEGGVRQETHLTLHQKEQQGPEVTRPNTVCESGELQQQQTSPKLGLSSSREDTLFDYIDSTRASTQATDTQEQRCDRSALCSWGQGVRQPFLSSQGEDLFGKLLLLSSNSSNAGALLPGEKDDPLLSTSDVEEGKSVNPVVALCGSRDSSRCQRKTNPDPAAASALAHSLFPDRSVPGAAEKRETNSDSFAKAEAVLAPLSCRGVERESVENQQVSSGTPDEMRAPQHREHETNYFESLAAAIAASPPGLDVSNRTAALRAVMRDTRQRLSPVRGQPDAQDEFAALSPMRQTQKLLEVLASGWRQQQGIPEGALKKQHEEDIRGAAEEGHEQCPEIKKPICESVLQHMPVALQYLEQLQHALSSERLESGTPRSPASTETSLLLKRLLCLPACSDREALAQPHEQEKLQQQHWEGVDCSTHLTCRRSSGVSCDVNLNSSSAAVSAARELLTRSHRSVTDLAKLLESPDSSSALKETTAATFVHSTHGGSLPQGLEESQAIVLSNTTGINANCNINNRSSSNSSNSSAFSSGTRLEGETEAKEVGDRGVVSYGGLNVCNNNSLSGSCPPRATAAPARSALHETRNAATVHSKNVAAGITGAVRAAEAAGSWGLYLDEPPLPASIVRGLADSNPFPEELLRRQYLPQVTGAAASEAADKTTFNERQQCTGAAPSQHTRPRVTQMQHQGKRALQHQRLPQQLRQDHRQTLPQRRDNGQQTATQELLDRHALQLLRTSSDPPDMNIFLQGFLAGDLLQQCNFGGSSCRDFVGPAVERETACNLLQQCGNDESLTHQETKTTDSFCDLHVGGTKQR